MKQQPHTTWGFRSLSFWLTLLIAVGIIVVGFRFFIDPAGRFQDFGIPIGEGKQQLYGYVKGIRDIFSGIVFLYLLSIRARRIVAVLFTFCILIPTVDCITNIIANGTGDWHLWIHAGTAMYMALTSVLLFKNSVTSHTDEI